MSVSLENPALLSPVLCHLVATPRLFISYSWSNRAHEAWVLQIATELRDSGVDVILDKWDLKEGDDAHAFMEQMVSDASIQKVLMICDEDYVTKADERKGGVGTETQIITPEIYSASVQAKFVAVVRERRPNGEPFLPIHYRSRIYIDLSDQATYADNFDKLLRWIFDKPVHKKPALGSMPNFLNDDNSDFKLATSSRCRSALEAIRTNSANADGLIKEYFDHLITEFEKLRLSAPQDGTVFDDIVVASIDAFLPYRNEVISVFASIARFRDTPEVRRLLHRFFEGLIPFLFEPSNSFYLHDSSADNYRFIIHELFLYCIALLVKNERFQLAAELIETDYYVPRLANNDSEMFTFEVIRKHMPSLFTRNQRLELNRLSLRADMLEQRSKHTDVPFRDILQADFILFLRDHLDRPAGRFLWYPETLLYVYQHAAAFEVFARSKSARYFDSMKPLLGISSKTDLADLLDRFKKEPQLIPKWSYHSFSPRALTAFEQIGTKP